MKKILKRLFKVKKRQVYDLLTNKYQIARDLYFLGYYINTEYKSINT